MWNLLDRLGVTVLDAGLAAATLLGLVSLAMAISRQPVRRLRLARVALLGSLALIPLIGCDLVPRFDLLQALRDLDFLPHPLLASGAESLQGLSSFAGRFGHGILRATAMLYLGGVLFGLTWLILGCLAAYWVRRQSDPPSEQALALLASLPLGPGVLRPSLRISWRVRSPMLVGMLRPLILIPPELDSPAPDSLERLKLILLHELAHAEGADPGFGLLANLARVFWFFLPPLWWMSAQIRLDQEFVADRKAALAYGPFRDYASSLVDLASAPTTPVPLIPRINAKIRSATSPLFFRVIMLLKCPFPVEARPPTWWTLGVPCLAALITLGLSTLTIRPLKPIPPDRTHRHQFAMGRLELAPALANIHGRVPLFEFPVRLPERFDLTMEVWGSLATLSKMRVSGLPLDAPARSNAETPVDPETWHSVRLCSDNSSLSLRIDDVPVDLLALHRPPISQLTPWLSVEPAPDYPGMIQNLLLTW